MRVLLLFILFFSMGAAFTQGTLEVRVVDEKDNPVEYANVRILDKSDSSVVVGGYTMSDGEVIIESVPFGNYIGETTFFGYKNYYINNLTFSRSDKKVVMDDIQMSKLKNQNFDEVVVEGKTPLMESSIDKRTYNVGEDMTTMGGGLTELLNNIPSVEVDNDGNVSLRGNGSVTILIDGRPSAMSSGDGALEGIPASAIERIELVTNPSAKYDPDGTAGIINIVLKKKKLRGINLNVDLTAASENLYNGNVGFNARTDKVNFYANYSFRYREGYRNNFNERTSLINDTTVFLEQNRLGTDFRRSHTVKLGSDFFISDRQVIGVSASGTYNDRIRRGDQINYESFDGDLNKYWERNVYDPRNRKSIDINADYKLDFKEEKGNFIVALTQSIGNELAVGEFEEYYYNPDGTPLNNPYQFQNQERTEYENTFTASADLIRNITDKIRVDAGLKAIISEDIESNYLEYYDSISDMVVPDPNVNNKLTFNQDIYSAYGIFGHQLADRFKYQVGLRLEQAFSVPRLVNTNESFENDYFSFFPSAHVVYGDKKMGELFLSYSRRINRPRSYQLNPFPVYSDPLNLREGNPALNPEYINSYEIGYEKIWKKLSLTNSIYFKETVDRIQRIRQFYDDGRSVTTYANVDESYDLGVEIIGTYTPFDWWKNMISINAFESRLAANIDGVDLRNRGISWNAKWNSTFYLFKKTTTIQINAQYIAPRFTVQGVYQRNPGIDIGFNRLLLDKKLSLGVRLTDVFDQKGFYFEINNENVTQVTRYKWTTRRLYFTVSYKFGNIGVDKDKASQAKIELGGDD